MATMKGDKAGYHHGDLRNALIGAAVELAAEGGPERVVLREAARRVGVSATAAYRHFKGHGALLEEVKVRGQLALTASMESMVREGPELAEPGEEAVRRVLAIGRGYVRFAVDHPGLYRTAFCRIPLQADAPPREPPDANDRGEVFAGTAEPGDAPEYSAFRMLTETLDALVRAGRMSPENRPGAEVAAWSAVHGLCLLILDGPLAGFTEEQLGAAVERTLAMVVTGLAR